MANGEGVPFIIPRQSPVKNSASLGGAKLYFYQTGTTTDQTVYSDAHLGTAHSQPVVADSDGIFDSIYLNPAASVDYRVILKTSADVTVWDESQLIRYREVFDTGTLTGTWTGFSSAPSNTTINWYKFDRLVQIVIPLGAGTSNATSFTLGTLPAAIRPATQQYAHLPFAVDSGSHVAGGVAVQIDTGGVLTFSKASAAFSSTGWTGSGSKGINTAGEFFYRLANT